MTGRPHRMSLLDALLAGDDPLASDGHAPREGLRRDLCLLFSTRPRRAPTPASLAEVPTSVTAYGMGDLRVHALGEQAGRDAAAAEIAALIRRFEPRLAEVTVEAVASDCFARPRFRVRAVLRTEGGDEAVAFDAVPDAAGRSLTLADPAER